MKLNRIHIALLSFVFIALPVRSATLVWTNTAGGLWATAANWSPNAVPAPADTVIVTNSGTYTITVNASATSADLTLGATNATGTPTILITAGTFTVTNTRWHRMAWCS